MLRNQKSQESIIDSRESKSAIGSGVLAMNYQRWTIAFLAIDIFRYLTYGLAIISRAVWQANHSSRKERKENETTDQPPADEEAVIHENIRQH